MKIPEKIINAVAEKEENLGYYINTSRANLKLANYDKTSYNVVYYNCYIINPYSIPTGILKLILKFWKEDLSVDKNIDSKVLEELKKDFEAFALSVNRLIKNTKKIRKAKNLDDALDLMQSYFRDSLAGNGWIYRKDLRENRHYPFLVERIKIEEDRYDGRRKWIAITLLQNTKHETEQTTISIDSSELKEHKNSIPDVIRANNIIFETDELKKEYQNYIDDFYEKEKMQNMQFVDKNKNRYINDNEYHKETEKGRFSRKMKLFSSSSLVEHADNCPIPYNPLIYMFNLTRQEFMWVDTRDITLYEYNKEIINKLILPEEHKGLIDILTNDFIQDNGSDIVEGKSGGSLILCRGEAGLGKTLTAEIYSDTKEKPLYSVHSGQLGIKGSEVEEKLKVIFKRAERWGAVLLIDEADVYIRERDNETNHNAIVASFLRVLEYYDGLLFMTTNRSKDIDDAILSRCMAVLTYRHPKDEVKSQMWEIYLKQFNINFKEKLISDLTKHFEKVSGRDIKNITRLASRYMQGYNIKEATIDVFDKCAIFRGIKEITD